MSVKRGPRSIKASLEGDDRCIYCSNPPTSIEHMPPIWIFQSRQRPRGYEFASCKACNNGTRGADFAVGWFARLRPFQDDAADPLAHEAMASLGTLESLVPGLRAEVFDHSDYEETVVNRGGVLHDVVRISAEGPILAGALTTFGAKLGMAMFREHIGRPLDLTGSVFVQPFMNGGLSQIQADAVLGILPGTKTLRQGRRNVSDQFAYAYNSDDRSIVMALASFHRNLHFLVLATSDPDTYRPTVADQFVTEVRPGRLLEDRQLTNFRPEVVRKSEAKDFILPGLPRPRGG